MRRSWRLETKNDVVIPRTLEKSLLDLYPCLTSNGETFGPSYTVRCLE